MNKLIDSIRKRPLNLILMVAVFFLYYLNNKVFKVYLDGLLHEFCVSYLNDLMVPFFFVSYCNFLLLTVGKELTSLKKILII